jgi:hypothetical protein
MVICKVSAQLLRMNNRSRFKLIIGIELSYYYWFFTSGGIIQISKNTNKCCQFRDRKRKASSVSPTPGRT